MVARTWYLFILVGLLAGCWGGGPAVRRATPTAVPEGIDGQVAPPRDAPVPIPDPAVERLSVEVEPGDPPNVSINVAGQLADRCHAPRPDLVRTSQTGRDVVMTLPAEAAVPCAPSPVAFDARLRVPLEAPAPGIYRLTLNGVAVTFELTADDFR